MLTTNQLIIRAHSVTLLLIDPPQYMICYCKRAMANFLVVWGEKFTGGKDEITITFSKIHRFVNIYDPTTGTLPISTKKRVKSVQLTMSDHPVVVEIY